MEQLQDLLSWGQQMLFENVVEPLLFYCGLGNLVEDGFDATMWLLLGLAQLAIMLLVFAPLQRWRPAEAVHDRPAIRTDILYTAIHSLGLFRLVLFFTTAALWNDIFGYLHLDGVEPWHLDQLWPGVTDVAWVSLLMYLIVSDFLDFAFHFGEHRIRWMWALHGVHHSQRQMTIWSDSRNHLVSDLLRDTLMVVASHLIGVAPGQFVAIVIITRLVESFSHANLRLDFGPIGQRLLVGPRYHRQHHGIGSPYRADDAEAQRGCNFSVLFPVWDILFGTARFDGDYGPTGIGDQLTRGEQAGRDYGRGFVSQQWLGIKRMLGRA